MIGTSLDPSLVALAPQLLTIESIILALFLAFSMLSAWDLKSDPASFFPRKRSGEISAVVLLLIFWATFGFTFGVDQSLIALELSLALILSMVHPALATGTFIILLFLRPWEISSEGRALFDAVPRSFGILALLSATFYLVRSRTINLRLGPPVYLLMAFAFWSFLSTFKGSDPAAVQSGYFDVFFKSIIVFILVTQGIRDATALRILKSSLIFAALGISVVSIYRTLNTPDLRGARLGLFGILADPNDTSAVMILIFPFALYALKRKNRSVFLRAICLLTLISSGVLLYFAKSRGALLALLITIAAMVIMNFRNKRSALIAGGLALALFLPLSSGFNRSEEDLSLSTESRKVYWETATIMAMKSPLFGVGFNGYPLNFERYTPKFIESGNRTAHSSWFLALAESGFPGLALFVALYVWTLRTAWRLRHEFPEIFFSTLGYGIAMSFLSHTYAIYFYLLMGIVFVVSRLPAKARGAVSAAVLALFVFAHATPLWASDELLVEAVRGSEKPIGAFVPKTASSLELSGSRGETVNFQLKIRATGCVKLGSSPTIRFYEMPYVRTEHASFPGAYVGSHHDPLPPIKDGEICPNLSASGQPVWTWIWGELHIPENLKPGTYSEAITLTAVQAKTQLPLKLHVWKMQIPADPAVPLYAEYSSWYGVLGHFGKSNPKEGELAQLYVHAMQEHRIAPLKSWVKVPKLTYQNSEPTLDLDELREVQSSFRQVVLDPRAPWQLFDFPKPFNLPAKDQDLYWRAAERALVSEHLTGKGFVYLWDEPKKENYRAMIELAARVKRDAPDLRILVTTSDYEKLPRNLELEKSVDLFVPVMNDWDGDFNDPNMSRYRELQSQGKRLWTYLSCMSHGCSGEVESGLPDWVLDRPSVWIRSMSWLVSRMKLDGFLYYDVDYAYQFFPKKDPWTDLWYFTGNGDGTLFYPGRPGEHGLKEHQPVDSIRLKVWREASFDAEYIRWMQALPNPPEWWKSSYERIVRSPRDWSRNYADYQNLRDRAGEYLNSLSGAAP